MISQLRVLPLLICVYCVLISAPAIAQSDAQWKNLKQQVESRASELDALIEKAEHQGLATDRASVSRHVIATYLIAAQYDKDHVEEVRKIFQKVWWYSKTDPKEADKLPWNEMNACLDVAEYAIAELKLQIAGTVKLVKSPDFFSGSMTLGKGSFLLDGKPVFPYSLVWLPGTKEYAEAFGNTGGSFYQLMDFQPNGTVKKWPRKEAVELAGEQAAMNAAPLVHLMGHAPAQWMGREHPEIEHGARYHTKYDIDSPLVRLWIEQLCAEMLPAISNAVGDQLQVHLLANEPHFATKKGGWKAKNGVSQFTMEKYRQWIAAKYQTVDAVNQSHGSSFKSLDQVTVDLPIDPKLRGSALWYDWCRFNMDRVNEWFTFLKKTTQQNDPSASPVSIKTLGHSLGSPDRDGGIDVEYLTKLQEIPGADLRVVPLGATFYAKNEDGRDTVTGWASRYAYLWVDQSMVLDFSRSLCPDRPFYDSEWHGFGTVSWRHHQLDRDYVRSAFWMAFTDGMGMIKPWLWGRRLDGALSPKTSHIGELATQPVAVDAYGRVMKELNAHAEEVMAAVPTERHAVIFYCEEAAIQSEEYMEQITDVYESLKLLNLNVGFITPSDMHQLNPKSQTLVVPATPFISDASLSSIDKFQASSGRVVLIDAEKSFRKNELGIDRSLPPRMTSVASLKFKPVLKMADELETAFADLRPATPLDVEITDAKGAKAYGVMISQSIDAQTGFVSLVLNNVSKDVRVVKLSPPKGKRLALLDSIHYRRIKSTLRLESCAVRLLKAALQ